MHSTPPPIRWWESMLFTTAHTGQAVALQTPCPESAHGATYTEPRGGCAAVVG